MLWILILVFVVAPLLALGWSLCLAARNGDQVLNAEAQRRKDAGNVTARQSLALPRGGPPPYVGGYESRPQPSRALVALIVRQAGRTNPQFPMIDKILTENLVK